MTQLNSAERNRNRGRPENTSESHAQTFSQDACADHEYDFGYHRVKLEIHRLRQYLVPRRDRHVFTIKAVKSTPLETMSLTRSQVFHRQPTEGMRYSPMGRVHRAVCSYSNQPA